MVGYSKIKNLPSKWNVAITIVVFVIMFIILFSIILYYHYNHIYENNTEKQSVSFGVQQTKKQPFCTPKPSEQSIECQNFDETNLQDLAEAINEFSDTDYYKLILNNIGFNNGIIEKFWLKDVELQIKVLEIKSSDLKQIGKEAFNGKPFENLESLTLTDLQIDYLKRESFLNTQITTFAFILTAFHSINIEQQVLDGMANTLTILTITNSLKSNEALMNLTGTKSVRLPRLQILDLRLNQLSQITSESFTNCLVLQSLYLSLNVLNHLDLNSFHLQHLQNIDISSNLLETLPEGIFDGIESGLIQIQNNFWRCDCALLWFKEFFIEYENILFGGVDFLCNNQIPYDQVRFCDNDTVVTTTTTTTSISSTTTVIEDDLIWLDCKISQASLNDDSVHFSHSVAVRNNTIEFSFYQIDDTPQYIINIVGDCKDDYLLSKNANNRSDMSCFVDLSKSLKIGFNYDQTYTLCLLENDSDKVSPYDCTSLTVPPEWSSQTWLDNSEQPLVIGLACLIILLTILLSSLSMFYCIRQNPNLIRGNKRVIIVGNKTADAIVLPKTYQRTVSSAPSLNSYSDGYLTPKNKIYKYKKYYYGTDRYQRRPISTIYEQNPICDGCEYGTHRLKDVHRRRRISVEQVAQAFHEHLYEPPPLPPNHPCDNKLYSNA